jgi:translocation and assembly module TamB
LSAPDIPAPPAPEEPTQAKPRRRWWLRLPLAILAQALLLVLLALGWLLGTQSGLRFALGVADEVAPGLLRVEEARGRVLGDLHLTGVAVHTPGLDLGLRRLDLAWSPLGTLAGTLRVKELTLHDLDLTIAPSEEPPEDTGPVELPAILLPIGVELEQILVENVSIRQGEEAPPFVIGRAALSASLRGSALTLRDLSVSLPEPQLTAQAKGRAELTGDYPLDLGLDWALTQAPALSLTGEAKVGGDLARLTLDHRLKGSVEAILTAVVERVVDAPRWQGTLVLARVDLPAIQADLPAVDLSGRIETAGDLDDARVQGKLTGSAPDLPDFGHLSADLDLTWRQQVLDVATLELTEDKSGAHLTADGQVDLSQAVGRFEVRAAWEKLRWPLTGAPLAEARQGKLDASGTFEAYRYALAAEVWGRDFPQAALRLAGEGDQASTLIEQLEIDTLDGHIRADGRAAWAPAVGWDIKLAAEGLDTAGQWPDLPARIGLTLTSAGGLDAFDYKLDGKLDSTALPAATLALAGTGDVGSTRLASLRIDTLGGNIQGQAEAAWDPQVTWDAALDLADIDPGKQWPEWKGRIAGHLESAGRLGDEGPDLTALIRDLAGTLRGYPVKANADVTMRGKEIGIRELRLASGPSRLKASGSVGERLDLVFDLDSPDLKTLLPEAAGSVRAEGKVSGTLEAPAAKLDLAADGVSVAGQGIERLTGKADLNLAPGGRMVVDLNGQRLAAGGLTFETLRVQGDGDMGAHRLSAKVEGEPLSLELGAGGGLGANNAYRGEIKELAVRSRDFGTWRLQRAAALALDGEKISAGPLCLRNEAGSGGCTRFEQTKAGVWAANLDLERLAFDLLAPFIPPGLVLEGEATAKASFAADGPRLTGTADVRIPRGVLSADRGEKVEALDFSAAGVGVDAGAKGLDIKLSLPLAELGGLKGQVSLPGWRLDDPARPDQALRGSLRGSLTRLAVVSRLVPDITNVTGRIDLDLGLAGSIGRPGVKGYAKLADGGLQVPFIGLAITDLAFEARAEALERIDYSGGFTAGDGRLTLKGQTRLAGGGPVTQIEASGERLRLANSKEYFLLASPGIKVEAGPTGASVTGKVVVPEARIRPRTIPAGTVSPSPDVVIGAAVDKQPAYPVKLDLRLVLGQGVSVDAFGLSGRIAGDLRVFQEPGKELLGDGELKVIDGTYRLSGGLGLTAAIGKPLTIEQGIIVFAKTPLSNPGLVLTAKREGGDVTAGVRVFGTLKRPKMTFFSDSDPGMSQAEVTNYLVTGIPPKGSGGDTENNSLSLGTYIAPKLFMEYESSIGDQSDKVKLRYELNNWVELQTETGDAQGGDIFIKLER